jgi:hypothetical protein
MTADLEAVLEQKYQERDANGRRKRSDHCGLSKTKWIAAVLLLDGLPQLRFLTYWRPQPMRQRGPESLAVVS